MRKRGILLSLALLLFLVCVVVGCQRDKQPEETGYVLYFLNEEAALQSAALQPEPYQPAGDSPPNPGELMRALLKGPQSEHLHSPFPRGVTFQWWEWDSEREGHVRIGLSEQYGGLTDIALTLADYSIVLTVGQLEGVESVEIVSAGHTTNYRSHQILLGEEAVLNDDWIR